MGGAENIPLRPLRFVCNSSLLFEINIFNSNVCEMYNKLNKFEHCEKCL